MRTRTVYQIQRYNGAKWDPRGTEFRKLESARVAFDRAIQSCGNWPWRIIERPARVTHAEHQPRSAQ